MEQKNEFLGTEPIRKITVEAVNSRDRGTDDQSALQSCRPYLHRTYAGKRSACADGRWCVHADHYLIASAFAALVSNGGAPRASMAMGKGDYDEAERILSNSFSLQLVISFLLTIVLLLFNRPLLLTFGGSENTIGYATAYMNIYAIGTVFVQLTLGMNAFITAQGFAKTGMLSVLIGAVCNIILIQILIYGFDMGVRGAAVATVLSQAVSTIWVLCFLTGKRTLIRIRRKYMRMQAKIVIPGITLGLAPFIMQASESIIIVCFNASLLKYGGDVAVGAMTILSSAMQFSMLPMQGHRAGSAADFKL